MVDMRNRAKCKLCSDIIESFHATDYVICKCGQISVEGGEALRCAAMDWDNFLRVDDLGNEIIVTLHQQVANRAAMMENIKPTKKELLDMLDKMIKDIEGLPEGAMLASIQIIMTIALC